MASPHYNLALLVGKELRAEQVRQLLSQAYELIKSLPESDFDRRHLDHGLRGIASAEGIDPTHLFRALRVAFQGNLASPGLYETISTLGKSRTLDLLAQALRALGDRAQ